MADDLNPEPSLGTGDERTRVIGVRFRDSGRIHYFELGRDELQVGTWVVCTTSRGQEAGRVVVAPQQVLQSRFDGELRAVDRVLTQADVERVEEFHKDSDRIVARARGIASFANIDVKVVAAELAFDGSTVVISVTTSDPARIEELREVLTRELGVGVQMRHIGPRDDALLIGGIGTRGRVRAGVSYENEHYRAAKQGLPRLGQRIQTPEGKGLVVSLQVFKELVTVRLADPTREQVFPAADVINV